MNCGEAYHLRMTETAKDAKDCGWVEMDDERGAIFTCNTCLEEQQANQPAPPLRPL